MRAVSDTGPLIHLSWINKLDLLAHLFEEVIVPTAVRDEVLATRPGTIGLNHLQDELNSGRLRVSSQVTLPSAVGRGLGEAEALALARNIAADIFLSDDSVARVRALSQGLKVMGTVGILMLARDQGLISAVLPMLIELRGLGQWLSDGLMQFVQDSDMRAGQH